ncbi:MAG: metal ABC transporter ATP-binding protein [Patescibacteria group bacterium]
MNAITTKNLTVQYSGQTILDRLTFDIPARSITAIIGPNGSGKTTLLRALLGLIPFAGEVEIFGKKKIQVVRTELAYVPQHFTFDTTFPVTVQEFLELEQRLRRAPKENINALLMEVGMSEHKYQMLGKLSGGQLQRVLIAKAMLNGPRLLFLDEPATGIDIKGERNVYELIRHLNKFHGVTVLLVSHELDIVFKYATQVICLNRQMLCFGRPDEVLTEQHIKELYNDTVSIYHHKADKHG